MKNREMRVYQNGIAIYERIHDMYTITLDEIVAIKKKKKEKKYRRSEW